MSILRLFNNNRVEISNFTHLVSNLVSRGFHDFYELDIGRKEEIVGRLLRCLRDPHEFLTEHDLNGFISKFSDYLIFGYEDDMESYNKILLQNAIEYYAQDLDEYFTELASNKYDN
jgi:hypothetical protein